MKLKNKLNNNKMIKYKEKAIKCITYKMNQRVGNKNIYNQKLK